ncbi:hypothetical protein ACFYO5_34590 [Streptomyces sp. NPDC006259]|uniref:hypothetical protein n=1 Tax=Streptomyces sp. NPDC006259 TaxID=3364740 RepID=UPI0036A14F10
MTTSRAELTSGPYTFNLITGTSYTTVELAVTETGDIVVTGPLNLSHVLAKTLVDHKAGWIGARLQHLAVVAAQNRFTNGPCPRCLVSVGSLHMDHCTVARCAFTGLQRFGCGHGGDRCRTTWSGQWPGDAECIEYGFYSRIGPNGWESCSADASDAMPDINRLYSECRWDVRTQRMVLPDS